MVQIRPSDPHARRPTEAEFAAARAEASAHLDPPGTEAAALAAWIESPLGPLLAVADDQALRLLEFPERAVLTAEFRRLRAALGPVREGRSAMLERAAATVEAFFADPAAPVDLPLAPLGTAFQLSVWAALREIPSGATRSYAQVAARIGRPTATRAVAAANGANPIAVLIPCHRVIGADGTLTGYGGGLWRKRALLAHESPLAPAPHHQEELPL
ncbi:methylated-DNA--[protein]-cysteine S-methyltransferase [Albimonas pacifica]|uniref:Methylated-DNA--protein-cysteine methyltransferase n=1 Tax=Albimonas pacifica TaxID=1114924 RepID=A0A1I3MZ14_9RHOB|nr:methylated-DNA--[protein]-cysteine S-methyltransferase [Albimonas pacifica]SFJ02162.1 methylated-DNA-[protein]-cysteine S-methyltransferase/AraC family transcriptional regulator, regulatory protein of adaptative response / methylated-DNA-[protein]-cysteine methyltransferase [Albimonas pacifica]